MSSGAKRTCVFSVNWGRHVGVAEFKANVRAVLDSGGDDAILGIQELDEADLPPEHAILKEMLDGDEALVGWRTFEPIVVPEGLKIRHAEVIPMCKGLRGWTPARFLVEVMVVDPLRPEVPPVVWMNQHPPRNVLILKTRRAQCRKIHRERVSYWHRRGLTVVWTGDMNDPDYPATHPHERTAIKRGLDYIRYIESPIGAQVEVVKTGALQGTIDGHDPIWAILKLTQRGG